MQIELKYKWLMNSIIGLAGCFSILMAIVLWGELKQIRQWQFMIRESLPATITNDFQVDATINHEFPVHLNTKIPVRFPVSSVVEIPIRETFMIPLDKTFPVVLNTPLRLKETVRIQSMLPIETEVETRVLGVSMTVPVKGVIPLDLDVPLDQDIQIQGEIMVKLQNPLPVAIDHSVDAPLNFMVEGIMPLDTTIQAPVEGELDCNIHPKTPLRVDVEMALSVDDVFRGVGIFDDHP